MWTKFGVLGGNVKKILLCLCSMMDGDGTKLAALTFKFDSDVLVKTLCFV